jgi:hypothetical protein
MKRATLCILGLGSALYFVGGAALWLAGDYVFAVAALVIAVGFNAAQCGVAAAYEAGRGSP